MKFRISIPGSQRVVTSVARPVSAGLSGANLKWFMPGAQT